MTNGVTLEMTTGGGEISCVSFWAYFMYISSQNRLIQLTDLTVRID